jgi:hypothetical protein
MSKPEEARQAVADKLRVPWMEADLIRFVQSTFRPKGEYTVLRRNGLLGTQLLAAATSSIGGFVDPLAAAHGEVLLTGGLRVPVVVVPVGASDAQLHRLSQAAQNYARRLAADRLGVQLSFVAVRRAAGVDAMVPAVWTAETVRFR